MCGEIHILRLAGGAGFGSPFLRLPVPGESDTAEVELKLDGGKPCVSEGLFEVLCIHDLTPVSSEKSMLLVPQRGTPGPGP